MMSFSLVSIQRFFWSVVWVMILFVISPVVAEQAYIEDKEYLEAVTRMYAEQMTRYVDPIAFRPADILSRQEAARFFVRYATNTLGQTIDTSRYCSFDDLEQSDMTLRNDILQACLLRLFKGSQGNFFPEQPLTKAQALTVLLRMTHDRGLDETGTPWWQDAYTVAYALGYTKETDVWALDAPITRYEFALILSRVDRQLFPSEDLEDISNEE